MLSTAVTKYSSANADDKALAEHVLDNPMEPNRTMEALVAVKDTISAAVVADEYNAVNTEAVTDAAIITAVGQYWASVAKRRAERVAANTI
jgi:hypothetical protein